MSAISLAIIGKNNEPLYLREFTDDAGAAEYVSEEHLFGLSKEGGCSSIGSGFECSLRHQVSRPAALCCIVL